MVKYPEDWKHLKLKELGSVRMCRRVFQWQTKPSGQIPFYKIGTFGGDADSFISRELFETYKNQYPYPEMGDVLISAAGTIGRIVVFSGEESYYQDSNIVWLHVNEELVYKGFLFWFYRSYPWNSLEGTTIQRLYNSIILNTSVHLPDLTEQKCIAETLERFDTHVANLTALIEKKRNIRDGALEDLVSGRTRLAGFEGEWETVSFNDVIIPKARIGWQGLKKHEYLHHGYSYLISGTDFRDGSIVLDNIWYVSQNRYEMDTNIQVSKDDVLVTKDGTIGKVAIVPDLDKPATLNSHVYVFRTKNKLHGQFLYSVLQSSVFRSFIDNLQTGSIIVSLAQKDLKRFRFNMPTDINEQDAIASSLMSMDAEISALEAERDKMIALREGAIDDLLTGRVRLKP